MCYYVAHCIIQLRRVNLEGALVLVGGRDNEAPLHYSYVVGTYVARWSLQEEQGDLGIPILPS